MVRLKRLIPALADALVLSASAALAQTVPPEFLRHRIEAYAASAAIGSCLCRTAFGVWKPCREISHVEL